MSNKDLKRKALSDDALENVSGGASVWYRKSDGRWYLSGSEYSGSISNTDLNNFLTENGANRDVFFLIAKNALDLYEHKRDKYDSLEEDLKTAADLALFGVFNITERSS